MSTQLDTDPVAAYVRAIPPKMRAHLNITGAIVAAIHIATQKGWTTQQLVDFTCNNHGGAVNHGAIIAHRLTTNCAASEPPAGATRLVPLCGRCDHGWLYNETTDPPKQTRCPCRTTEGR